MLSWRPRLEAMLGIQIQSWPKGPNLIILKGREFTFEEFLGWLSFLVLSGLGAVVLRFSREQSGFTDIRSWRKRVGVEPTIRPAKDRIAGFEGREGHRTNFASAIDSTDLSEQLEIGSKPPSRSFVSLSPQEPAKIFVLVGSKVIYTRSYGGGPASFHRFF